MQTIGRNELIRTSVFLCLATIGASVGLQLLDAAEPVAPAAKLLAHWPLAHDARDVVGTLHGQPMNIEFGRGPDGSEKLAALFNG